MFIRIKGEFSAKPEQFSTQSSGASTTTQRKIEVELNPLFPFPQSTGGLSHLSGSVEVIGTQSTSR